MEKSVSSDHGNSYTGLMATALHCIAETVDRYRKVQQHSDAGSMATALQLMVPALQQLLPPSEQWHSEWQGVVAGVASLTASGN